MNDSDSHVRPPNVTAETTVDDAMKEWSRFMLDVFAQIETTSLRSRSK